MCVPPRWLIWASALHLFPWLFRRLVQADSSPFAALEAGEHEQAEEDAVDDRDQPGA